MAVDLVLVLRQSVIDQFDSADQLFATLFESEPTPLRHSEAWLLASAMRDLTVPDSPESSASAGYRTRWARDPYDD